VGACQIDGDRAALQVRDGRAVRRISCRTVRDERRGPGRHSESGVRAAGRGAFDELGQCVVGCRRLPAPDGRIDQLDQQVVADAHIVVPGAGDRCSERLGVLTQSVVQNSQRVQSDGDVESFTACCCAINRLLRALPAQPLLPAISGKI
jgi:hypothetical protein